MDLELRLLLRKFREEPSQETYRPYLEKSLRAKVPVSCYFCEKVANYDCEEHQLWYCEDCGYQYQCGNINCGVGVECPLCLKQCSLCSNKCCPRTSHRPSCEICQIDLRDPNFCSDCVKSCWGCNRNVCAQHMNFGPNMCRDCLANRRRRRNPDDDLRLLERKYQETKEPALLREVAAKLRRAGQEERAEILEEEHLNDALTAYYEAFWNFMRLRDTSTLSHSSEHPQYEALVRAKIVLTQKSKEIDLRPGYHCYRPYHHIPYVNEHILELAFLNDALGIPGQRDGPQAWRNDDGYYGHAVFPSMFNAENFKEDMIRNRYIQRDYGFWIKAQVEGIRVSWESPK